MRNLKARVTLTAAGFRAELTDGRSIEVAEVCDLARVLHLAGVAVDDVHCADWHTWGDLAPLAGQALALKVEMRRMAKEAGGI